MKLVEDLGLPVAEADVDEALTGRRSGRLPRAAVLRVPDPPPSRWPELADAGFVRKPAWLTWVAPVPESDEDLLGRLPRKAAQDLRRAITRTATAGLRFEVQQPVDPARLDAFIELYERRVAEMRYGFAFARRQRESMVGDPDYFAVFAFDGEEMAGGCLARGSAEEDVVWLRFSGVLPKWRAASLARVLYVHAFRAARQRGFGTITLGNDPNLYGHVAKPGLYLFKSRLGFDPVPAARLSQGIAGDVAELVLSLDLLTDPSLVLGYDADAGDASADLALYAFCGSADADLDRFRSGRIDRIRRVVVPAPTSAGVQHQE